MEYFEDIVVGTVRESDEPKPVSEYGRSKRAGEVDQKRFPFDLRFDHDLEGRRLAQGNRLLALLALFAGCAVNGSGTAEASGLAGPL